MKSKISDIQWVELPSFQDERGCLTAGEVNREIPFEIKRIFMVHDVIEDRGGHAHRDTNQVLLAACGSLTVRAYDGESYDEFLLNQPNKGLLIPNMIFVDLVSFSEGCVCLSLASTHYDIGRSIRTLSEFEKEAAQ